MQMMRHKHLIGQKMSHHNLEFVQDVLMGVKEIAKYLKQHLEEES